MFTKTRNWLWDKGIDWLNAVPPSENTHTAYCNFEFLEHTVRPADVILFAGKTRVSSVIQMVTLSPWTHAALYVGRINDIRDPQAREKLQSHYKGSPNDKLVVESLLGLGTVVNPLSAYREEHLRICRPSGLDWRDADPVVNFAIEHLGMGYDVQQLMDLARFLFPYGILPRRWRSSLFQHNAGRPTHIICSSMIARCFQHVQYPVLPVILNDAQNQVKFRERNFRLFIPSDFDYSPYFEVIKYPAWHFSDQPAYRSLPWQENDESEESTQANKPNKPNPQLIPST